MTLQFSALFAAEKDRGYCGRIIDSSQIPGAAKDYDYGEPLSIYPAYILAIQCDSEPISKNMTLNEIKNSDDIGFAVLLYPQIGQDERVDKFAKN